MKKTKLRLLLLLLFIGGLIILPQKAKAAEIIPVNISVEYGQTEALKAENQMLWVQRMNNIRSAAMEIVANDLIYA